MDVKIVWLKTMEIPFEFTVKKINRRKTHTLNSRINCDFIIIIIEECPNVNQSSILEVKAL